MSNSHIQNCHVTLSGDQVALGCDYQGVRYHVWLQDDLIPIAPLYKTPPNSSDPSPRKLQITSKFSSRLIAEMLQCMKRDNLLNKALADRTAAEAEKERKCRNEEPIYLVAAADRNGWLHFVAEDATTTTMDVGAAFTSTDSTTADHLIEHPDSIGTGILHTSLVRLQLSIADFVRLTERKAADGRSAPCRD